jgi:D-psicose/D-tagatose/L-ribulose 3-epimerase
MGLGFSSDISSGDPENVARGEARLNLALSVSRDFGAGLLTGVLYSAQGRYRSTPTEAGRWNCVRVLARLAERAAAADMTLGLEVVNRYDSNLINTAGQALALIEQIGASNLVVHLNSYHMNLEEDDPAAAIERCGARLGYVQIGESHRGYLGTGTIDFGACSGRWPRSAIKVPSPSKHSAPAVAIRARISTSRYGGRPGPTATTSPATPAAS